MRDSRVGEDEAADGGEFVTSGNSVVGWRLSVYLLLVYFLCSVLGGIAPALEEVGPSFDEASMASSSLM